MRRRGFSRDSIRTRHLAAQPVVRRHDEQIQFARTRPVPGFPRPAKPADPRRLRHARARRNAAFTAAGVDLDATLKAPLFRRNGLARVVSHRRASRLLHAASCPNTPLLPQRSGARPMVLQGARPDPRIRPTRRIFHAFHSGTRGPRAACARHPHPSPRTPRLVGGTRHSRPRRISLWHQPLTRTHNSCGNKKQQASECHHHRLGLLTRRPPRLRGIPPTTQRRTGRSRSLTPHRRARATLDPLRKLLHLDRLDHRIRHPADDLSLPAQPWHPPNVSRSRNGRKNQTRHHADRQHAARKRLRLRRHRRLVRRVLRSRSTRLRTCIGVELRQLQDLHEPSSGDGPFRGAALFRQRPRLPRFPAAEIIRPIRHAGGGHQTRRTTPCKRGIRGQTVLLACVLFLQPPALPQRRTVCEHVRRSHLPRPQPQWCRLRHR